MFEGTHNFSNFSKRSERNPIRTIDEIKIIKDNHSIQIDVYGESFLWNMVRKIVTVLLMVGKGEIEGKEIKEYFNPKKEYPIRPMPPEGLILMEIVYSRIKFQKDTYARKSFKSFLNKEFLKNQSIALSEMEMMKSLKD
jgi:tRNA pseudouridine38-40 synthase